MSTSKTPSVTVQGFDFNGNGFNIITVDGEPWFKLAEVCGFLGITNPSHAKNRLEGDEFKTINRKDSLFLTVARNKVTLHHSDSQDFKVHGPQSITIINESGFYNLVLSSDKAKVKGSVAYKFRRWVTNEVLPTLRKTGKFEIGEKVASNGDPTRLGGQADIFNPPRSSKEVEIYSPPVTEMQVSNMLEKFSSNLQIKLGELVSHYLANSDFTKKINSKIRISVAEMVAERTPYVVKEELDDVLPSILDSAITDQLEDIMLEVIPEISKKVRIRLKKQMNKTIEESIVELAANIEAIETKLEAKVVKAEKKVATLVNSMKDVKIYVHEYGLTLKRHEKLIAYYENKQKRLEAEMAKKGIIKKGKIDYSENN